MNHFESRAFYTIWLGQLISVAGSGLSEFALGLWVYQQTGSITQFGLVLFCKVLPALALAPLAGVLVDRYDRRAIMILADTGAALGAGLVAALVLTGRLAVWEVFLAVTLSSAFGTFQRPAYLSSITLLVPPKRLGQSAGMVLTSQAVADIASPILAGLLLGPLGLGGILLIDALTFVCGAAAALAVRFGGRAAPKAAEQSVRGDLAAAAAYLRGQPRLISLLAYFALITFLGGAIGTLLVPMVLGFAGPAVLGVVLAVAGGGLLLGGLTLSAWGGPADRLRGVFVFGLPFGLCLMSIGLRPSALLVAVFAAGAHFAVPFVAGLNQALWQAEVPLAMQGRVFALREMLVRSVQPLAPLATGLLADRVFAPLSWANSPLAGSLNLILGAGPGRGLGLLFVSMGSLALLAALVGLVNAVRRPTPTTAIALAAPPALAPDGVSQPR